MTSAVLCFADPQTVADFRTYTARARVNDGAMRLVAAGSVLAGYVCTLRPTMLGEAVPTVLGLRTMALREEADVDSTVALGSVLERLARMTEDDIAFQVPTVTVTENWSGVLPPRSGWMPAGSVSTEVLEQAARDGIAEVARNLPARAGAPLVSSARTAVWGRPLRDVPGGIPAGAAFGAFSLGFLASGTEAGIYVNGRWARVSTGGGHILVRAAAVL